MSALDRLVTRAGGVIVDLENVTYWATPLKRLDENIRTCIVEHRDLLLDVRSHLYGTANDVEKAAAAQWASDAESAGCEPRAWADVPEPFKVAQRWRVMPSREDEQ